MTSARSCERSRPGRATGPRAARRRRGRRGCCSSARRRMTARRSPARPPRGRRRRAVLRASAMAPERLAAPGSRCPRGRACPRSDAAGLPALEAIAAGAGRRLRRSGRCPRRSGPPGSSSSRATRIAWPRRFGRLGGRPGPRTAVAAAVATAAQARPPRHGPTSAAETRAVYAEVGARADDPRAGAAPAPD